MKFFGVEINCGCEERRMRLKQWWADLTNEHRGNVLGKTIEKDGYLYTLNAQGDVIKEMKIQPQVQKALDANKRKG